MTEIEALILGALQGISEFLPISSSGHLTIAQHLFGLADQSPITLNLALHIATLAVIIVFYRKTIKNILFPLNKEYITAIIITSIPTGIIGILIKLSEKKFPIFESVQIPSVLLIINGIFIFSLAKFNRNNDDGQQCPSPKQAFFIGIVQGIAALPGISRSGSTIGISRIMGIRPELATEFSLLASIPAILGATLLEAKDMKDLSNPGMVILGAAAAAIFGWFSVKLLLKIVNAGAWRIWGIYCMIAGLSLIIFH